MEQNEIIDILEGIKEEVNEYCKGTLKSVPIIINIQHTTGGNENETNS